MGLPLVGVGLHLPPGLFPSIPQPRRLAAGSLSRNGCLQPADPTHARQRRQRAPGDRPRAGRPGARHRLESPDRPRAALSCSTPTSWKTRPSSAKSRRGSTRPSQDPPRSRRCCSASAGCAPSEPSGIRPKVVHMNEGHCAFAGPGTPGPDRGGSKVDLKTALQIVPRTTVFTTHTPVAAGHDEFPADMVRPYLKPLRRAAGHLRDGAAVLGPSAGAHDNGPLSHVHPGGAPVAPPATG